MPLFSRRDAKEKLDLTIALGKTHAKQAITMVRENPYVSLKQCMMVLACFNALLLTDRIFEQGITKPIEHTGALLQSSARALQRMSQIDLVNALPLSFAMLLVCAGYLYKVHQTNRTPQAITLAISPLTPTESTETRSPSPS
jgi:hypothetical protein